MEGLFIREMRYRRVLGEADWPGTMALALFLARRFDQSLAERFIGSWTEMLLKVVRGHRDRGIPSPYWLPERVLESNSGQIPPYEQEEFGDHSYSAASAADMLVRRGCRQRVAALWPGLSRLTFVDYMPAEPSDWFRWKASTGDVMFRNFQGRRSWSEWRAETATWPERDVPPLLLAHPHWTLPFALTYPHRANRSLCAMLDGVIGGVADPRKTA